jgi:acetyltransferase-like isoleucine patch superfamily enzyme
VKLKGKEFPMQLAIPTQVVPTGTYTTHFNTLFAVEIISPFHLLQANIGLNVGRMIPFPSTLPVSIFKWFSKPFSRRTLWGLKRRNQIGKNCQIHPTAVIEGCQIGDNVIVGANAVLRLSIIGENTYIGDTAVVTFSIVGKNNYIMTGNHIQFCLTYESVFTIHGPYQFSIFGKNTAVFATINCDIRLDEKTISIPTENGIIDSKQYLLGIAYGHYCKVGASNIIAAGRIVPNRAILNPPDFIHLKFDVDHEI